MAENALILHSAKNKKHCEKSVWGCNGRGKFRVTGF